MSFFEPINNHFKFFKVPNYVKITEKDFKSMAPIASLISKPGKYKIHFNIFVKDHVILNVNLFMALRNPTFDTDSPVSTGVPK